MIAAASHQASTTPATRYIYKCNIERIRRDFSKLYPALMEEIRAGSVIVMEGP